ncbi:hypothetical protein ACLOJK_000823 [Asimina triloba]
MSLPFLALSCFGTTVSLRRVCYRSYTTSSRHHSRFVPAMSARGRQYNPNRGGGRGGGRRGGGGGGGGRGEQRWWDPVWRAERLRQKAAEVETLDVNEWRTKMHQFKEGAQQELVVKRDFGRDGQQTMADMAYQLGLYFHAYNKGKTLVVSKVPLPDYRADLDERHGSTQKEIRMSVETEKRVENLLVVSNRALLVHDSVGPSNQDNRQSLATATIPRGGFMSEDDSVKKKLSVELRDRQQKFQVKINP